LEQCGAEIRLTRLQCRLNAIGTDLRLLSTIIPDYTIAASNECSCIAYGKYKVLAAQGYCGMYGSRAAQEEVILKYGPSSMATSQLFLVKMEAEKMQGNGSPTRSFVSCLHRCRLDVEQQN